MNRYNKMQNIVLIGMPGCGKSTIGKMLAEKLDMHFIDLDKYIEKKTSKSIAELFDQGEAYFRELESQAISDISSTQSTVISTGGGVIKKQSNIEALKQNGMIIFIDRPVEQIASDIVIKTRPLLKGGTEKIYQLFNERYKLYHQYCDILVKNDQSLAQIVENIRMAYEKRGI